MQLIIHSTSAIKNKEWMLSKLKPLVFFVKFFMLHHKSGNEK
jgi:hypothetical protein